MEETNYSILIVDDNTQNLQVLANVLESSGYEIGFAMSGKQALDYIKVEKPDLILLDVMMPELDGYETCSILKNDPELCDIPVIFLTAKVETEDIVKGFSVGGVDYISKPFISAELKSRVKTHLELKNARDILKSSFDELRDAKIIIENQNTKLNEMVMQLEVISKTDPLTGLANRRSMVEAMEREEKANSNGKFSVVIADIDFFKIVNDTYGHDCGDFILKEISELMDKQIKKNDFLSRWGGEEFLMMFTETSLDEAVTIAERIRLKVSERIFQYNNESINLTMTFGVSEYKYDENLDEVIKRADNALYEGKNTGRNKVVSNR